MQPVPPVNIIMSFDYKVMQKFQEYSSLAIFRKDHKEAKFFDNAPMSVFVSLTHQLGLSNSKKGAMIEIEFLDPEGTFEQEVLKLDTESNLDPNESLLRKAVDQKRKEHQKHYSDYHTYAGGIPYSFTDPGYLRLKAFYLERLEKSSQELEELEDKLDEGAVDEEIRLQTLMASTKTANIQKPVFIAYGVGDNLKDWCPPQCFGNLLGAEYNFNSNGVRTIKLSYAAISVHPNLTELGIGPLGYLGYGTITEGYSHRIFNRENFKIRNEKLEKEVFEKVQGENSFFSQIVDDPHSPQDIHLFDDDKLSVGAATYYVKDGIQYMRHHDSAWYRPSLHQIISTCMKDFIRKGCKTENVIVLLPNLDEDLSSYVTSIQDESNLNDDALLASLTKDRQALFFGIYKEIFEDIGLDLIEYREDGNYAAIGNNHYEYLEECTASEERENFFQTNTFKVVAQVDNVLKTFEDKLNQIAESLAAKILEFPSRKEQRNNKDVAPGTKYFGSTLPPMDAPKIYIETDYYIIQLMLRFGLISDGTKPVVIWGSDDMISLFIHGELSSKAESILVGKDGLVENSMVKEKVLALAERNLNPFDETTFGANISKEYLRLVDDYTFPSPWIAPFGPTGGGGSGDENFLSEDMSVLKDSIISTKLKSKPSLLQRQPIFAFGTKNTNVTDVAMDVNKQYLTLLNNTDASNDLGAAIADSIVPKGFESEFNTFWDKFNNMNLDDIHPEYEVPNEFVELVSQWAYQDKDNQVLDINGTGKWDLVFNALKKGGRFEDPSDVRFVDEVKEGWAGNQIVVEDSGMGAKLKAYYNYMFDAFTALFDKASKVNRTPRSKKIYKGKNGTEAAISTFAKTMDKLAKETITGNITTLPMFSLGSHKRVMNRPCKLLCIEPQMFNQGNINLGAKKHLTWFSGAYQMMGFRHTINNSTAKSEFMIIRPGASPADPDGVSDFGEPENPEEASNGG